MKSLVFCIFSRLAAISTLSLLVFVSFLTTVNAETPLEDSPNRFGLGPLLEPEPSRDDTDRAPFHFDQNQWNEMRQAVEEGRELGAGPEVDVSTVTAEKPKPPPGQIHVELPYESSLSVTGRKVIRVEVKNTQITQERADELNSAKDTQSFTMEQELQARIQGTVARKTTINVNFDDTKDNVRDFSVVYKGDPDEVVQEAAFGDIVLSLPSTEFVNYNKQLFGIRAALKYKRAGLMMIGSRTKGNTETKRFTGTTKRQQIFVNDTSYIRRKHYDLTFATSPAMIAGPLVGRTILPISDAVPELVYIQDNTSPDPIAVDFDVATASSPGTTVRVRMRQMSRGVDYNIDRNEGIITFVNTISEDARVAIDFTLADGGRLSDLPGVAGTVGVLIKDQKPEASGVSQEIKRFYSAGARNIVRDNGLGNFLFRVLDQNRETEIGDNQSPLQRYPDTIDMDFETGIFELENRLSFTDVYASNVNSGSPLHAVFSLEYQSIVRTYTLRPNIVLQSETVEVDGRKVNRDLDYFIDYDIGIITFFNDDLIRDSTVIEVTYEFAPFGGQLGETLVGARGTFDLANNKKWMGVSMEKWAVGSTLLFNFAAKPSGPPDVRSSPSSLLVTEGDTQVKGIKFGKVPIVSDLTFEKAKSSEDPNLFGKALIDSMEGLEQEDAVSLFEESWEVSSNPQFSDPGLGAFNTVVDFRGRLAADSHLRWVDEDVATFDTTDSGTQKGLRVNFDLNTDNTSTPEQVSLISVLSRGGRDFSKKTSLEIELEGAGTAGAGVDLIIDYGSFNEDADGDGTLDTEDTIPFDDVLNLGEDIGWEFDGPGDDLSIGASADNTLTRIIPGNAELDSEDLNGDRILATNDFPATFTPLFSLSSTHTATLTDGSVESISDLSFTGRRLISIPLNLNTLTDEEKGRLTAVKHVRITIRNLNGASVSRSGSFVLAKASIVGISWEPAELEPTVGSTMTISGINNKDNSSTYGFLIGNPAYNDLYQGSTPSTDAQEQALAMEYTLLANSTGATKNTFGAPRDFSKHGEFRFFLSRRSVGACTPIVGNPRSCGIFFLQAGSENEYQQISVNVADIPTGGPTSPNWLLVNVKQVDLDKDGSPESWQSDSPLVRITRKGNVPILNQISQLKVGVFHTESGTISDQVWVNEIHLSVPNKRDGNAERVSFDSTWTNWMSFGGSKREVDRLFQTPTTQITNQDREQETAYANLDRIRFLPMTYKFSKDKTTTPSAFRSNTNALVSFIEEGVVEKVSQSGTAKLILPKLPIFDFAGSHVVDENNVTQRKEIVDRIRIGATYSPRVKLDLLPGDKLSFKPIPTSMTASYSRGTTKLRFPSLDDLVFFGISTTTFNSTDLSQFSEEKEARMAFAPWGGFTVNPTYKLREETEKRFFRDDELLNTPQVNQIDNLETPRSLTQNVSVSGNLRLLKWLEPRYSYSVSGTETNGLPTLSEATGYFKKTITRNSQGEVSGAIQMARVFPKIKLVNSMNTNLSYKIENGDTYQDVDKDFEWRNKLWVGNPLDISSGTGMGRRTDLTDRRIFRGNVSWLPFGAYSIGPPKLKPLKTLSLTSSLLLSTEDSETTGTSKRVESKTFPDLILTINDTEEFFGVKKVINDSRLVFKTNERLVETISISKSRTNTLGSDYQFKFFNKLDFSTSWNHSLSREDNLVTNQLTSKTQTDGYAVQTRFPWGSWSFTPRYERNETDARDSIQQTNDLVAEVYSMQIYGDITRPFGVRFGRREFGFANRLILNSTIKWDKKRSSINPQTNFVDIYSASLSGDYTISKNFRLALGGNFSQEAHHPDFDKLDKTEFGINSTLTIQF